MKFTDTETGHLGVDGWLFCDNEAVDDVTRLESFVILTVDLDIADLTKLFAGGKLRVAIYGDKHGTWPFALKVE